MFHFSSLIYPAQKSSISASIHCLFGCPGIKNQGLISIHCLFGCPGIKNNIPPVCTTPPDAQRVVPGALRAPPARKAFRLDRSLTRSPVSLRWTLSFRLCRFRLCRFRLCRFSLLFSSPPPAKRKKRAARSRFRRSDRLRVFERC